MRGIYTALLGFSTTYSDLLVAMTVPVFARLPNYQYVSDL